MITARRLCSATELELVSASFASDKTSWTSARLHSKIQRTRKLRDKYRDLVRRTRAAGRVASGGRYDAQPKTQMLAAQRVKLFDETLARYIAKLARLNAAERAAKEREAGKRKLQGLFARGVASPNTGSRPPAGKAGVKRAGTPPAPSKRRPGPRHAVKAHVRARNQRRQAARDAK